MSTSNKHQNQTFGSILLLAISAVAAGGSATATAGADVEAERTLRNDRNTVADTLFTARTSGKRKARESMFGRRSLVDGDVAGSDVMTSLSSSSYTFRDAFYRPGRGATESSTTGGKSHKQPKAAKEIRSKASKESRSKAAKESGSKPSRGGGDGEDKCPDQSKSPMNFRPRPPADATCITQDDFKEGSLIIDSPGDYKLCEDISFGPLGPKPGQLPADDAFDPKLDDLYKVNEFGMGFFAAICIACSDVNLHLNGYKIEQSEGHALFQRFFAVIELASSPFIPNAGPAQFVSEGTFAAATNVKILGPGTIGRSSHHGIHGNENVNVTISGVTFVDFEVAAAALNNVDNLEISQNIITKNRQDVPTVGMFSAGRFIRPYARYLKDVGYEMKMYDSKTGTIVKRNAADVYDKLITSINNVYEDVVLGDGYINKSKHPEEHNLFDNPFKAVDGPCYAFLIHGRGPAIGGQGQIFNEADDAVTSSNVVIKDNKVSNIKCWNNEIPALFSTDQGGHGFVANDPRGSIIQTINTYDDANPHLALGADGKYNGNVISDVQVMVAKAIADGVLYDLPARQIKPNSIKSEITDWVQDGTVMDPKWVCNGDSMHHVIKGAIIFRVEDTAGFDIKRNTIENIENVSVEPFMGCVLNHVGASPENKDECQSANIRAISIAAVRGYENSTIYSHVKDNTIRSLYSENANVIVGIDVQGDSQMTEIEGNIIDMQEGVGQDGIDQCIAIRIRESTDTSIDMDCNQLDEDTQVLNSGGNFAGANFDKIPGHSGLKPGGGNDWVTGGCPFAADYANVKV